MARGRKVNSNGERSKQLLLEKAIELFSIHGYHETKISDIVKAADLTQPTFYLYFQSKDKLFNDLNEQFSSKLIQIFHEKMEQLRANHISSKNFVHETIQNIFEYFYENPNLTKIGFYEAPTANELKDQIADIFISVLNNERGNLELDEHINVETVAHSVIGTIERLTLKYILTKQSAPNELATDVLSIYFSKQYETANR
jgi:AcrR family transcriptional regulator